MKKLFMYLAVISMTFSVFAQSPQKMSYQAVIRNASNALVTSHAIGMRISILQGSATGTPVYVETQTPTTNANGLATIEIGGGTIVTGTFAGIDWSDGTYFIKTETDPTGGTNYTISGTSQLLSVPYALHSKTAENGFSGNYIDLTNKPILFSGVYNDLTSKPILFDGTWASLTAKPSFATVATSGSYNDLTNKPALFSGNYNDLTNKPTLFNGTWANITGKPTTLTGYGITDGMNTSHVANGITSSLITNWNTAYSWGNHAGLYRPVGYVPAWNEITGKPTFATVATSGSYTDLSNKPTILASQWTTSGSNIYYNTGNVGIGTSNPATFIHAHGAPVASRGQLSLSSPAGQGTFISFYEADIFKAYLWFDASDQDLRLQNYTAGDLNLNPYGGNVGIGTNTPGSKLEVAGQIKITGGTPAVGQVLTSDGTGLATWEPPAGNDSHYIGESYGGGIIFYLDASGKHGLIAATTDQSTGIQWYNGSYTNTTAFASAVGAGDGNTSMIVFNQGAGTYAAKLCYDLNSGGFIDWYLPSKYELNLMYQNIGQGNLLGLGNVGGFANNYYWSSTEINNNYAWIQVFANGNQLNGNKYYPYYVLRAVRAF